MRLSSYLLITECLHVSDMCLHGRLSVDDAVIIRSSGCGFDSLVKSTPAAPVTDEQLNKVSHIFLYDCVSYG